MCKRLIEFCASTRDAPRANKVKQCKALACTVNLFVLDHPHLLKRGLCSKHSKAASIELKDKPQGSLWRFCQQCNKIEPLSLFEGKKRSCCVSLKRRRESDRKARCRKLNPRRSVFAAVQQTQEVETATAAMSALPEWRPEQICRPEVVHTPASTCPSQLGALQCPAPDVLCPPLPAATPVAASPEACTPLAMHQPMPRIKTVQYMDSDCANELAVLCSILDDDELCHGEIEQLIAQELQSVGGALLPEPVPTAPAAVSASVAQQLHAIELQLLADIEANMPPLPDVENVAAVLGAPAMQGLLPLSSVQSLNGCSLQCMSTGVVATSPAQMATANIAAATKATLLNKLQLLAEEWALLQLELQLLAQHAQLAAAAPAVQDYQLPAEGLQLRWPQQWPPVAQQPVSTGSSSKFHCM